MSAEQIAEFAAGTLQELVHGPATMGDDRVGLDWVAPEWCRESVLGCLVGGAVGDALGAPIEFDTIDTIRGRYGPAGVTGMVSDGAPAGQVTDDTQMTLFTLEGLIRADLRRFYLGQRNPLAELQLAYQRWLHTQGDPWPQAAGSFLAAYPEPDGWLVGQPALFAQRSPGTTCLSALRLFGRGHAPATMRQTTNDSKGCGGVMRAAPAGLWTFHADQTFELGAALAALTHGHPTGYLTAGAFAVLIQRLLWTRQPERAIHAAVTELEKWPEHEETARAINTAQTLARKGLPTPEQINEHLGQGFVAEEALAIALCCVLAGMPYGVDTILTTAVNHSGDSDSTGALAGNLAGALFGLHYIPQPWIDQLDPRDTILRIGEDALTEFAPQPPRDPHWIHRYPVPELLPDT